MKAAPRSRLDDIAEQQATSLRHADADLLDGHEPSVPSFSNAMNLRHKFQIRASAHDLRLDRSAQRRRPAPRCWCPLGDSETSSADFVFELIQKQLTKLAFARLTLSATASKYLTNAMIQASTIMKKIEKTPSSCSSSLKNTLPGTRANFASTFRRSSSVDRRYRTDRRAPLYNTARLILKDTLEVVEDSEKQLQADHHHRRRGRINRSRARTRTGRRFPGAKKPTARTRTSASQRASGSEELHRPRGPSTLTSPSRSTSPTRCPSATTLSISPLAAAGPLTTFTMRADGSSTRRGITIFTS